MSLLTVVVTLGALVSVSADPKVLSSKVSGQFKEFAPHALSERASSLPSGWFEDVSCATDMESRLLPDYYVELPNNTPAVCINTCASLGYAYAGVEYGLECQCAHAYSSQPASAAASSCNMPCAGDSSQICGGTWTIGLYTNVPRAAPIGQSWTLADTYIGPSFLSGFEHEAIPDPTGGRVNYVDQTTALSQNLTFAQGNTFIIRADSTNVIRSGGRGRNSVRVKSRKTYTRHLATFDVRHMPEGCATWPALWWTTESNWPNGGELDIIEGVNNAGPNLAILHTTSGCTMQNNTQTGISKHWNCDYAVDGNAGCGVAYPGAANFGPPFNTARGGWYAMERTAEHIRVWYWPRDVGAPAGIATGASTLDTRNFGTPVAYYPKWAGCDLERYLGEWSIIINLTLCGGWAGNTFNGGGCVGVCDDYVNNNPTAFKNAFWELGFARVYL